MPRGKRKAKEEEEEEVEEKVVLKEIVEDEEEKPQKKKKGKTSKTKKDKEEVEEEEDDEEEPQKKKKGKNTKEEKSPSITKTDFSKPAKKDNELKIVSWNVAGFNAVISKGFADYVKNEDPDIICLQETKIEVAKVKADLLSGYHSHFLAAEKKGYAGTAIYSKIKPISWKDGIDIADHDTEGRCITAEYENFYLVNTYIPNAGRGLVDLDYRKKWDKDFLEYLKKLDAKKTVIWCGDLNVAHNEIDLKNPKQNKNKSAGFSDEEREGFSKVLASGFVDTFRHLYPTEAAYTFWAYRNNARAQNIGWRLDYFVISKAALDKLGDSFRRPDIMGSDHCPIVLHIGIK